MTAGNSDAVIKGWDEGVKTFKKGEKALLTCKSEYAYGEGGSPPKIPSNATLNFEVGYCTSCSYAGQSCCLEFCTI